MAVVELPAQSFDEEVWQAERPVVVEFWIRSCGNCEKFKPIYDALPSIFNDAVKFVKMNMFLTLDNLRLAEDFGVEETPTLKVFCKGRVLGELVGYRPLDQVVDEINLLLDRSGCGQ